MIKSQNSNKNKILSTQITAEGFNPQSDKKSIFLVTWSTYGSRVSEKTTFHKLEGIYLSDTERQKVHDLLVKKITKEHYLILALNILDDHVHLILHCTETELTKIVQQLKGFSSRNFNQTPKGSGETQRLWGKGFSCSEKENHQSLIKALQYVDSNHEKHELKTIKLYDWENNRKEVY